MRIETDTTICAIATGSEGAVRGIVRITGPDTLSVLARLFETHRFALTQMRKPSVLTDHLPSRDLGPIPVAIHCWPTHRSYTGQPSAELHALGAPVVLREIQSVLIANGLRLAEPGEFTLRAFLAGRLDLTQCEAVLGLIHARGERAFRVALEQLAGGLTTPLKALRRDLLELLADLEAGLDFVDEDIEFIEAEQVLQRLHRAKSDLFQLNTQLSQRAGQEVVQQVALIGLPNAGKSSLVNAMSGREVAITSQTPGTTRDYVRSRIERDGMLFDLLDTAGLEEVVANRSVSEGIAIEKQNLESPDSPRSAAQSFTQSQLGNADLILYCSSMVAGEEAQDEQVLQEVKRQTASHIWRVWTKVDLAIPTNSSSLGLGSMREFHVSSKEGTGVEELLDAVVKGLKEAREQGQDVLPMTGARCREALLRAEQHVQDAWNGAAEKMGDEIVAAEIRLALDELGQVAGTVVNNDILDALFSRFCIGK